MPLDLPARLGPYDILSLLGTGGMGEVYRARDERLGRQVAIKVLPPSFAADADRLRRFELEARAVASLSHPNVLHVHDTGVADGMPYLVMELLEGDALRHRLKGHPLPLRKALEYALQMARGLAAAHEKGITHRDLKPENIFITRDEQVKILDFGLAKLERSHPLSSNDRTMLNPSGQQETRFGSVVGTAGYMSPEQVEGGVVDPRSDIFAVGIILWEMLTGHRPFQGTSTVDLLHAILRSEPAPWPSHVPLPAALERILYRCLHKSPQARFQNAADLAFALEGVDLTSSQRWAGLPMRLPRRLPRRILVTSGILLLCGLAYVAGRGMAPRPSPTLQRLTYHHGTIRQARFTPDGENLLFSMDLPGQPSEVWLGRLDGVGAKPLGLPPGTQLLAVSPRSELAILLPSPGLEAGMLSRVPLTGGEPREVADRVLRADWSPDGENLAVLRHRPEGGMVIEYPVGHVVYEAPSTETLSDVKVSPDGHQVAFAAHQGLGRGCVGLVDRKGQVRKLADAKTETVVWSGDGQEVLFSAQLRGAQREIRAVSLKGSERRILAFPNDVFLHDRSRAGRLLVRHGLTRSEMAGRWPGADRDGDLSWLQSTTAADLSHDGQLFLFAELQEGVQGSGVYIRRKGQSGAVRIGDGDPLALSPDGLWAAVRTVDAKADILLLPTGLGQPKRVDLQGIRADWAIFRRDANHLLLGGAMPGDRGFHVYALDVQQGRVTLLLRDIPREAFAVISGDGTTLALGPIKGCLHLHDLERGVTRTVKGLNPEEFPMQWTPDQRSILIGNLSTLPGRIFRLDLATSRRTPVRDLQPESIEGVSRLRYASITPDGRGVIYSFERTVASDLYALDAWH